jgi:hypothetical protein
MKTDTSLPRSALGPALTAAALLLVPLVVMQFTDEMAWDPFDFAVAWGLLSGAGLAYKLVAGRAGNATYRAATGLAVAAALLLVWSNLAVGIIGSEDNPVNLLYGGVLAIGFLSAIIARFQPRGMAMALFATALAQALVAVIALMAGMAQAPGSSVAEILGINAFFVTMFLGSGLLFRNAALEQRDRGKPGTD